MTGKVLIVEDEEKLSRILSLVLSDNGYEVRTASDGSAGIFEWKKWLPDIVISDLKMQPVDGMAVLKFGQLNFPEVPLIILTAFGSIETAVKAMKRGAFDFLTKPVDHDQLLEVLAQAMDAAPAEQMDSTELIGSSPLMEKVRQDISVFASSDSSVLIQGESGTGKEIAARLLYKTSPRCHGPFVKVNCAAIPRDLMESELFGHEKGAFTGALRDRKGAFVRADNGVLFLDEIGDLPLDLQAKLLQAVEEKTVTPVGSGREISISVKILSATNQNLTAMIDNGRFRSDLFYRLNTVCLDMPALRKKPSDIEELVQVFLKQFCMEFNKPVMGISNEAISRLSRYTWPGNVRELKNIIERAVLTCSKEVLEPEDFPAIIGRFSETEPESGPETSGFDMAAHEQSLMIGALEECGWNQSKAAEKLGITRGALRYRLQKYGIQR